MRPPAVGSIGATLLCCYLVAVALRIDGCYRPEARVRDDRPQAGPKVGERFPDFALSDVSGARIASDALTGKPTVLVFVPSLDWSPPTKARVLDLAAHLGRHREIVVAVVLPETQATPRSLTFVREHTLPFYFLVDRMGLVEALGLTATAPDGTAATLPATFVLDRELVVRLRDVRTEARTWLEPALVTAAAAGGAD